MVPAIVSEAPSFPSIQGRLWDRTKKQQHIQLIIFTQDCHFLSGSSQKLSFISIPTFSEHKLYEQWEMGSGKAGERNDSDD